MATMVMLLVLPLAACDPPSGPPVVHRSTVFQHNVEYTKWGAIRHLVNTGNGPAHIFLQELCHDSYTAAANLFNSHGYGYVGYLPPTYKNSNCGGNIPGHKEPAARQIVASKNASIFSAFGGAFPMLRAGQENGYACGVFNVPGYGRQRLCTTHLESSDGSINVQQGTYMYNALAPYQSYPTIVGGDFNRKPDQAPIGQWKVTYHEVDPAQNRSTWPRSGPYKKIDYVFTKKGTTSVKAGATSVGCHDTQSDHCYLRATINFH